MTVRPHLLYTAWSFPPSRAGGVYRAIATVNAFADAGWKVTVLTVPRELFLRSTGVDLGLEGMVHRDVSVERIDPSVPAYEHDLTRWSGLRARWPEYWKLADFTRDMTHFPEPNYGRWRPRLEKAAERIHATDPVDLAIGTANPHVDFIPGWHLHQRFGVPYVMDYRDAWQLDVFSGEKLVTAVPAVARWERKLIANAREVWFVNEPIRRWHAERYPSDAQRMKVVANGFDDYGSPLAVPVRRHRKGDKPLVFGYIGTISPKVPLAHLIDGWRSARRAGGPLAGARLVLRGYLGHFGEADATMQRLIAEAADDGVSFEGPVAKTEISSVYRGFDALVLALGTGRYVTSGKVYEYAATGLPIVSVHDPNNAATDVVRGSPAWTPARSLDRDEIADALVRTAQLAVAQTPEERARAQEWGARYARSQQLTPRIDALRSLVH